MSPLKLFEAMLSKRPIICANLPALKKIVNSSMVTFYQPDNPQDLAQKIERSLFHNIPTSKKCDLAYHEALKYSWQKRSRLIINQAN